MEMFFFSVSFHMDFYTGLIRGPTKNWSTYQFSSMYTVASLGYLNHASFNTATLTRNHAPGFHAGCLTCSNWILDMSLFRGGR